MSRSKAEAVRLQGWKAAAAAIEQKEAKGDVKEEKKENEKKAIPVMAPVKAMNLDKPCVPLVLVTACETR